GRDNSRLGGDRYLYSTDRFPVLFYIPAGRKRLYEPGGFSNGSFHAKVRTEWKKCGAPGFRNGLCHSCGHGCEKYRGLERKTDHYSGSAFYHLFCKTARVSYHYIPGD